MKQISVIVPIYNTRNELERCLNSIAVQTYKNLEILCVDDGSTDGSDLIADEFAKKDSRFKVIHTTNNGVSSARNVGLKSAVGEYIAFCDSDDWIDKNMYEFLVHILETCHVDMAAVSWYQETDSESIKIENNLPVCTEVFGRNELLKYLYMRDSYRGLAYMWNKLYRREVLEDEQGNIFLFNENLRTGEDVLYLAQAALQVKRVKYEDIPYYHYFQRTESACHTKDVSKLEEWIKAYEMILQKFEEEHIEHKIMDYVKRFLAYRSSNAAEAAIDQGLEKEKVKFQKIMRQYQQEYETLNQQYPKRIERYQNLLRQ